MYNRDGTIATNGEYSMSIELNDIDGKSDIDEPLLENENPKPVPKKKTERVYWIDCLRVFASMLVVYIHCTGVDLKPMEFQSYNWKALFFLNSLPRPCVPLFIMISGIFFLNPERPLPLSKLYGKNITHIFKSFVFWSIYYNLFDMYVINFNETQYDVNSQLIKDTVHYMVLGTGHLWYLTFVMGLYITTPIFRAVCKDRSTAWYTYILCVLVSQFFPTFFDMVDTYSPESFSLFKDLIGYFKEFIEYLRLYPAWGFSNYYILGYLLTSTKINKRIYIYLIYLIGLISIAFTVVLRFTSSAKLGYETNVFGEYNCFNVALSTLGIFTFFQYTVDHWMNSLKKSKLFMVILLTLSDCSYGIYLVHMTVYHFFYRFFNFHPQTFDPLFCAPIYSAIVFIISFIIIYLMRKIPFLKVIT
ncbi:hypothetical protein BCR32DRAFT_271829 [Anaeromyces robustus]|uniref:Acyltransferase 3 domain-containing protein n=1 Tax=Anaeromyces robustus TaxID=1754192 RepID=A0A1Y1WQA2_9FUNG|nr:hypothetical protein BCR32DRAFT_271829 [Anaeromyces robustus]|eukprot:ORX75575.1 hypothetical protein BCR32DRAFT_271829 [Anaeromyces robustus]